MVEVIKFSTLYLIGLCVYVAFPLYTAVIFPLILDNNDSDAKEYDFLYDDHIDHHKFVAAHGVVKNFFAFLYKSNNFQKLENDLKIFYQSDVIKLKELQEEIDDITKTQTIEDSPELDNYIHKSKAFHESYFTTSILAKMIQEMQNYFVNDTVSKDELESRKENHRKSIYHFNIMVSKINKLLDKKYNIIKISLHPRVNYLMRWDELMTFIFSCVFIIVVLFLTGVSIFDVFTFLFYKAQGMPNFAINDRGILDSSEILQKVVNIYLIVLFAIFAHTVYFLRNAVSLLVNKVIMAQIETIKQQLMLNILGHNLSNYFVSHEDYSEFSKQYWKVRYMFMVAYVSFILFIILMRFYSITQI